MKTKNDNTDIDIEENIAPSIKIKLDIPINDKRVLFMRIRKALFVSIATHIKTTSDNNNFEKDLRWINDKYIEKDIERLIKVDEYLSNKNIFPD